MSAGERSAHTPGPWIIRADGSIEEMQDLIDACEDADTFLRAMANHHALNDTEKTACIVRADRCRAAVRKAGQP